MVRRQNTKLLQGRRKCYKWDATDQNAVTVRLHFPLRCVMTFSHVQARFHFTLGRTGTCSCVSACLTSTLFCPSPCPAGETQEHSKSTKKLPLAISAPMLTTFHIEPACSRLTVCSSLPCMQIWQENPLKQWRCCLWLCFYSSEMSTQMVNGLAFI